MVSTYILGISILLQFVAAIVALSLIRTTRQWLAWGFIAAALILMGIRRSITFYRVITDHNNFHLDLTAEIVALIISILMLTGVLLIGPLFKSIQNKNRKLLEKQFSIDHAHDAIFWLNSDSHFIDVNKTACNLLGYSHDELLKLQVSDVDTEFPVSNWEQYWEEWRTSRISTFTSTLKRKDGYQFPVEITVNFIEYEDRENICVFIRDITERLRAEAEIKKTWERLETIMNTSAAAIYSVVPIEGYEYPNKITFMSENIREITGYTASDWYADQTLWINNLHPEDRDRVLANQDILYTKGELQHTYRFRRRDGTYCWVHDDLKAMFDNDGNTIEIVGAWVDISSQKNIEDALRESETSQRTLLETMQDGVFVVREKYYFYVNQALPKMLGYTSQEYMELGFEQIVHPDFIDLWNQCYTDCINNVSALVQNHEFKFQTKNGSSLWIELHIARLADFKGKPGMLGIVRDISERKLAENQLNYQANHDALTGLVNRAEFERRAKRLLKTTSKNPDDHHAMCYMDLDQFKVINDTCGHSAGDEMLRQLCSILLDTIRKRDTLARLGGDEFGVLMEHCSLDDAYRVVTTIQKAIQDFQFSWGKHKFRVGVSIGLVSINENTRNLSELMKQADAACYVAKEKGRNRIHLYQIEDEEILKRHGEMQWVSRLYKALEKNQFCLYAQSIVPLDRTEGIHYELLLRMKDDDGSLIPPNSFLPAAERYNLISNIDRWVVDNTIKLLVEHKAFMNKINFCSINLSGQSIAELDFLEYVLSQLDSSGIKGKKICFEITETAAITNLSLASKFIKKLKQRGCLFALDDFGSGLSSFAYLKNLQVDFLKIDGMFVRDIVIDPIDHAMVKSINEIGQVMGMKTIAEFVENDEIKGMLREIGVNYGQGYGIDKPRPIQELLESTNNIISFKDREINKK